MVYCLVPDCTSGSRRYEQDPDVVLHVLPKDKGKAAEWIQASKRANLLNKKGYICSRHFLPDDHERDLKFELLNPGVDPAVNKNRKLKSSAIPSQNIPKKKVVNRRESGSLPQKKAQAEAVMEALSTASSAEPER